MSEIILKERLTGYYYINASKADKQVFVHFQFSETESYIFNFIFPKCRVSYVFFFENPADDNKLYLSAKAALNLDDAMNQPNFELRKPMIAILIGDQERKSINFITEDASDQTNSSDLFNSSCEPTQFEKHVEAVVRQAVLDGNAGVDFTLWIVDGPMVSKWKLILDCNRNGGSIVSPEGIIRAHIPSSRVRFFCGNTITVTDVALIYSAGIFGNSAELSAELFNDFKNERNLENVQTITFSIS